MGERAFEVIFIVHEVGTHGSQEPRPLPDADGLFSDAEVASGKEPTQSGNFKRSIVSDVQRGWTPKRNWVFEKWSDNIYTLSNIAPARQPSPYLPLATPAIFTRNAAHAIPHVPL